MINDYKFTVAVGASLEDAAIVLHLIARRYPDVPERPSETARRFYYDTVGHGSHAALLCAWKAR